MDSHGNVWLTWYFSMSYLVLLGNDWNGLPSFQCLPPTILPERWESEQRTYAE